MSAASPLRRTAASRARVRATTPGVAVDARTALVAWMSPGVTGINRLRARASGWSYPDARAALADRGAAVVSLDGTWRFRLLEAVEATPADFAEPGHDEDLWSPIQVPGCWTMQGFAKPHYTNVRLPFAPTVPPLVPQANPTGLYRTGFTVPAAWRSRRLVLHFGAVDNCFSVWVNGAAVGFSKGSRLPSEFDITAHVRSGRNTLAVQVVRFSDSSYIEDQDHWRQSGIHRSVHLASTPSTFLEDLSCRAGYDHATGAGTLAVEARAGSLPGPDWTVAVQLHDAKGRPVLKQPLAGALPHALFGHTGAVEATVSLSADLPSVSPWSAETPTLYTVVATLRDPAGKAVESRRARIGFRTVEVKDRMLLINGRKVYIRGANRHDHHDATGKTVDLETMRADLHVLKAHNFNAVRCSHYPNDPRWLDLCDEHGLYLIDEADLECHHNYGQMAHDSAYAQAFLDRATRLVARDRNHPSVIIWSLGNESGYGANHDAMAGWIRHADPTRPLHYEGAICRANSTWERGHMATDLVCPMYPSIADIVAWATTTSDRRPLIMCEYAHAMGNSCGNLADYWAAIESHHGLQGGFIWELIDHGIRQTDERGRAYWAYGGDFGDAPNDTNFCCDGLIWPDRAPHPAMQECKFLFQPIAVTLADAANRQVAIRSKYDFITTAHLNARWELLVDGERVAHGPLTVPVLKPGESAVVTVPCPEPASGQERHLVLRFSDRRADPVLGKGFEVAVAQVELGPVASDHVHAPRVSVGAAAARVTKDREHVAVDWSGGAVRIARADGELRWTVAGRALIERGPITTIWRAPTDNDGIRAWDMARGRAESPGKKALSRWMDAGLDQLHRELISLRVARLDGMPMVRMELATWGGTRAKAVRESRQLLFLPDGAIDVEHDFTVDKGLPDLPRLGVEYVIDGACENLEWFGRGPHESYCDRKAGTLVARHRSTVGAQYVPYIMPQEHGNLTDLRWICLGRTGDGGGLRARARGRMEGKATRYADAQLTTARHTCDLTPSEQVHLYLDARQRGLGGASCGPDTLATYRVASGARYRLAYRLAALAPGGSAQALARALR